MRAFPLLLVLLGGCFLQGIRPTERLRETVYRLNDDTRWGRLDLAAGDVDHGYQREFAARRLEWGRAVRIADLELVSLQLAEDEETASSVLTVSWIEESTMTLHETQIAQAWERSGAGGFELTGERVLGGETDLFVEDEEEEVIREEEEATYRSLSPERAAR